MGSVIMSVRTIQCAYKYVNEPDILDGLLVVF